MLLLYADKINKSYSEKPLIQDISLSINSGDKIGLIGVNGSGKSTFLKILAGREDADNGSVTRTNKISIGYLPQSPDFNENLTIIDQVKQYLSNINYDTPEFKCRSLLTKLGFSDFDTRMHTLSGGQRKRVAMAGVLAMDPDLLILDEPTNHMDNDVIEWLEDYLIKFKGAVLMITHDRYFLDRITTSIVEIEKGLMTSYPGNYGYYLEAKAALTEIALASERKRASLFKKELTWIRRGARARATKARSRVERFEELKKDELISDIPELEISTISSRLGKKIIEINDLKKKYGKNILFSDFSYTVLRRDRIGIVGNNGSGKTTLLKIILGMVPPDEGSISIGETVKIGYFSQEQQEWDQNQRVIKYIEEISNDIRTENGNLSASQMLERFLFPSEMHSLPIGRLSGGERRRLYLLSILMTAPNVLLFDEPTNDLDIATLAVLEDYLDEFDGAVLIVSHDRFFLDRLAIRTFYLEDNGVIRHYPGGYTDSMKKRELEKSSDKDEIKTKTLKPSRDDLHNIDAVNEDTIAQNNKLRPKKLKFSFSEQREYETIEYEINEIETSLRKINEDISKIASDYLKLQELSDQKEKLERILEEKTERWFHLQILAEKIEKGGRS